MDGNGVWRFPEGSGRQGRMETYCCNVICGAPTTSNVKGLRWDEMINKTFHQTMHRKSSRHRPQPTCTMYMWHPEKELRQIRQININACQSTGTVIHFCLPKARWPVMFLFSSFMNEPRHDKTNRVTARPAKTQISLGIPRLIWIFAGRTVTLLVLSCRGSSSFVLQKSLTTRSCWCCRNLSLQETAT